MDDRTWRPGCRADLEWLQSAGAWSAFQFLARDWGQVAAVRTPHPSPQDCGRWQGPGSLALQQRTPQGLKVVRQVKCLSGVKRAQYVWIDSQADWCHPPRVSCCGYSEASVHRGCTQITLCSGAGPSSCLRAALFSGLGVCRAFS